MESSKTKLMDNSVDACSIEVNKSDKTTKQAKKVITICLKVMFLCLSTIEEAKGCRITANINYSFGFNL